MKRLSEKAPEYYNLTEKYTYFAEKGSSDTI